MKNRVYVQLREGGRADGTLWVYREEGGKKVVHA